MHLISYVDVGYLFDSPNAQSQTGYLVACGNTMGSWWSIKQTIAAISFNYVKISIMHEASRERV